MKRFLQIRYWPWPAVFLMAGLCVICFTFGTVNLYTHAVANLRFLARHGLDAISMGGLVQLAELLAYALASLAFFILFKICESELVLRYRRWQER